MNDYIETAKLVMNRYYDEVAKTGKKLETFRVIPEEFSALLRNDDLDLVETIGGYTMYFLGFGTRIAIAKKDDGKELSGSELYEAHSNPPMHYSFGCTGINITPKPFTITKEQYDKDIEQAKADGVSEYIRKMSADISSVNGCKVSWRDEEATKDDHEQGLTKEQVSSITKQIQRVLETWHD